jgi:hypothetical protein
MRQAHSQMTKREQMQSGDQSKGINMQRWAEPRLHAMVGWWGHGDLFVDDRRHH